MIPYQDLVDALDAWRASKGLPVGARVTSAGPAAASVVAPAAPVAAPVARTAPVAPPPPVGHAGHPGPAAPAPRTAPLTPPPVAARPGPSAPPPLAPPPEDSVDVADSEMLEEAVDTGAIALPPELDPRHAVDLATRAPSDHDGESTAIGAAPGPVRHDSLDEDLDQTMIGHGPGPGRR